MGPGDVKTHQHGHRGWGKTHRPHDGQQQPEGGNGFRQPLRRSVAQMSGEFQHGQGEHGMGQPDPGNCRCNLRTDI